MDYIQESIPEGCVPRLLTPSQCFFNSHQMSVPVGGPQVDTFEQVSSIDHQISLARGQGSVHGVCTVRSNASWGIVTWDPPPNRMTDKTPE